MGNINLIIEWQDYETQFMGEMISMKLRPLKRWAMFKLAPLFQQIPDRKKGESAKNWASRLTKSQRDELQKTTSDIQDISKDIFKDHVKDLKGINVNNKPVTFDMLSEEFVFSNLCIQICGELMKITNITKDDEKN